ncbi:MAG: ATP synthase F1 subunit epsilon [Defluviitaleaceae bacterium]|nr:ATP synthase F1 subunit epsilon [Defluviitaleaceae bacterium]
MAETTKKFHLRIITPLKTVFDEHVDMVIMETVDGQIGVMAGHEPVATVLGLGSAQIFNDLGTENIALFGGFVDINQNEVIILADIADKAEDIDAERARQARARAEDRLRDADANIDMLRAQMALRRSLVRLELSGIPMKNERQ